MKWFNKIMTAIVNCITKREYGLKMRVSILTQAEIEADKRFSGTLGYKAPFMQGVKYALDLRTELAKKNGER